MGDLLAGNGDSKVPSSPGKRVARHAAEQPLPAPYAGRRMAAPAVTPVAPEPQPEPVSPPTPYVGRRVKPVQPASAPVVALEPVVVAAPEPVVVPAAEPILVPTPEPVAVTAAEPVLVPAPEPVVLTAPEPLVVAAPEPVVAAAEPVSLPVQPDGPVAAPPAPTSTAVAGRRVAQRRHLVSRLPSAPLVAGIAVLAVSAGGALQAMNPASAGAASHRLVAANAYSGTSGVASASLLQGRGPVVSRSGDRSSADSLQAAADAQAQQRDQALSAFAAKAEKTAARLKLHQWVLPVAAGTYDLTARFGDYSSLWSHFHTGLDFAAPTGTPIMAVAGGTITETAYSGAFGNRTIETLPDGTELWYCHQNSFGTTVGATVNPGQVIGYVGSTGNVTGPHLHLEVHPGGGDAVDPYAALIAHGLYPGPPR